MHAAGLELPISNDGNSNAQVSLQYKAAAQSTWQDGHPFLRISTTLFRSSLFDLQPATLYDVRTTISDPDGVTGQPAAIQLTTRADTMGGTILRTLYVDPSGDDANPGTSPAAPLRTIQRAADLSQAEEHMSKPFHPKDLAAAVARLSRKDAP